MPHTTKHIHVNKSVIHEYNNNHIVPKVQHDHKYIEGNISTMNI